MPKKKKKAREKAEEKHFVVSFSPLFRAPRQKRASRAINWLKRFVFKHFRVPAENVAVSPTLNQAVWAKGREHIPRKIEVTVVKEKEKATIYLKGEKIEKPLEKEKPKEEKKKVAKEKKEEEEKAAEIERKKEEKKAKEKAAEAAAIKRGTGKEGK